MRRTSGAYLSDTHFAMALGVALMLHLMVFGAWMASPKPRVVNIPIRVLNLKLGDGETFEESSTSAANAQGVETELARQLEPGERLVETRGEVWNSLSKTIREKAAKAQPKTKQEATEQVVAALDQVARQFVRSQTFDYAGLGKGSPLGNSTDKNAELMSRYEQLLSAWLVKFQFNPSINVPKGTRVQGSVRVRLDRNGNIRYAAPEKSTRIQALDRTMLQMVERAKPFPPMPQQYAPNSQVLEFVFPITFTF